MKKFKINRHTIKNDVKHFKTNISKIFGLTKRFQRLVVAIAIISLIVSFLDVLAPKILSNAIDIVFEGVSNTLNGVSGFDVESLLFTLVVFIALRLLIAGISMVGNLIGVYVSQTACKEFRSKIARKIINAKISGMFSRQVGDTMSRVSNDVDLLGNQFSSIFSTFFTSFTLLVGSVIMMFVMNWLLALVVCTVIPITGVITSQIVKKSQKYMVRNQQLLGDINAYVEEQLNGIDTMRVFNKQAQSLADFKQLNNDFYFNSFKGTMAGMFVGPISSTVNKLCYIFVVILGAIFTIIGTFTVGGIQAFIQYMNNFSSPFQTIANLVNGVQQLAAAADRINDFLLEPDEEPFENEKDSETKTKKANNTNLQQNNNKLSITFKDVDFSYEPDKQILSNVKFTVEPGQTIAIVGPTGAGKTTISKLLMRYYEVDKGDILINNDSIYKQPIRDTRQLVSYVLQDIWIPSGSIKDAIMYGNADASEDDFKWACRISCCDKFVNNFKQGYDYVLNEDSSNLSAGQLQLITIARAVIAKRPILVLDEATSNIDTRTENLIYDAFDNIMEETTSIVIAHRLTTVIKADNILVLNNGSIVESGTHEQLINKQGFYYQIFNTQFKEGGL